MNGSEVWYGLVQHEWRMKGSWKRLNRSNLLPRWRLIYVGLILMAFLVFFYYQAYHENIHLSRLWSAAMGVPFMIFFVGNGMLKREWENDTHGWWLTLPYSRFTLLSAKWAAAFLRVALIMAAIYAGLALYTSGVVLLLPHYGIDDLISFLLTGLNWGILILGFSPVILAIGMLTASVYLTPLRPLGPVLTVASMIGASLMYSELPVMAGGTNSAIDQLSGNQAATFFPFPWEALAVMAISLAAAYFFIRLSAYLLDRKLYL